MSNDDWYSRKLGQPQPVRRESTPTTFPPMPGQPPPAMYQPPVPHPASAAHTAPERFDIDEVWRSLDPTTEEGRDARRRALLTNPKAGPGNRAASTCPNCGGPNFFPRRTTGIQRMGNAHPAPQCFDCGYPLVQSGSEGGGGMDVWSTT